jgi:hypothetical protein
MENKIPSTMAFTIMTLSIMALRIIIKKCDPQHNDIQHNDTTLSIRIRICDTKHWLTILEFNTQNNGIQQNDT